MDTNLKTSREETPSLCFDNHQDALDFVGQLVEESDRWLYTHSFNFVKRYINGDMDIVLRADINGTNSVCDFVLACVPVSGNHSKRARYRFRSSKRNRLRNRGVGVIPCSQMRVIEGRHSLA